jgi:hypothetical protein
MAQQLNTGNGDALRTIARMAQAIARSVTLDETGVMDLMRCGDYEFLDRTSLAWIAL